VNKAKAKDLLQKQNVIEQLIQYGLDHLSDSIPVTERVAALNFVTTIWEQFPSTITQNHATDIMNKMNQAIDSNLPDLQITVFSIMFYLMDEVLLARHDQKHNLENMSNSISQALGKNATNNEIRNHILANYAVVMDKTNPDHKVPVFYLVKTLEKYVILKIIRKSNI